MKKILSLLGTTTLIGTSTTSLVACNKPQEYTSEELAKLKAENKKLQDENKKLKWKIEKNILFINSINPPIKVEATKRDEVKEYEVFNALKPKVLEAIKTIDNSLTENDFIIGFKDYFNYMQPRHIDLSTSKKITIIIDGKNKATGEKEFVVVLPKI